MMKISFETKEQFPGYFSYKSLNLVKRKKGRKLNQEAKFRG